MKYAPLTCELNEGATVIFDVPDTTSEDYDDTHLLYELFTKLVGA